MFRKWIHKLKSKRYNFTKSFHSEFKSLPKNIRNHIKDKGIKDVDKKMFDVDIYYDIVIRNYWDK